MAKVFNSDASKVLMPNILRPSSPQPLDERNCVEYLSDLTNSEVWKINAADTRYEGMIVYVLETKCPYVLIDNKNPDVPDSWQLVGSGGSFEIASPDDDIQIDYSGDTVYISLTGFHGGTI